MDREGDIPTNKGEEDMYKPLNDWLDKQEGLPEGTTYKKVQKEIARNKKDKKVKKAPKGMIYATDMARAMGITVVEN